MYKKNIKLILSIILLIIISTLNSIQGYIYGQQGFTYYLVLIEVISFISTVFLLNIVWCVFDDGKCITIKKEN